MANLHGMKMVTVICEELVRPVVERLLKEVGAHGFTVFPVEGAGQQGSRRGEMSEFRNVQFEVIVQPAVAEKLMERLQSEYFPRYTMIAYEQDVRVLRREKF